ncbi:hypothetical protein I4U23_003922 [Adineta vaga]|nr:hypothetical protein I4U23_003922 [Adineta vaga]
MTLFEAFHNDPFFSDIDLPQALALEHRSIYDGRDRQVSQRRSHDHRSLDLFGNGFKFMDEMIHGFDTRLDGQGVAFTSSTIMSIDNRDESKPKIFQAISEKLRGPEGLERTRKGLRDTERNIEKMEVAHRLGERGHRIIKRRDPSTGNLLENREFDRIENEQEFQQEWSNRAEKYGLKTANGYNFDIHTNNLLQEPRRFAIE